jgi:hypothetical protein
MQPSGLKTMRKSKLTTCIWVPRTLGGSEDMANLDKVSAFIGHVCRLNVLPNMALNEGE